MARRYNKIVIRRTNGLEIVCFNYDAIYIKHNRGINLYHRWFIKEKYFYRSKWKPFRRALTDHRFIDMQYINKLADKYEIEVSRVQKVPDYKCREVIFAREHGRNRNVH